MSAPTTEPTTTPEAVHPVSANPTLVEVVSEYVARVRGGAVGSLPAIFGLVALVIVFSALKPGKFTNAFNFANLINQASAGTVLAIGLVFVLLLGEIDLSAGYTAGTCAAVIGIASTEHGWPVIPSLLAGALTGAVVGVCIGLLVAKLGIPSFVVTLAAFLGLQGVMLKIIGDGGTIPYRNETLVAINNDTVPVWLGWILAAVALGTYAGFTLNSLRRRRARGLVAEPMALWMIKIGALTLLVVAFVGYLSKERSRNPALISLKGVPIVAVVVVVLLIVLTFMLNKTAWGRHVYAVGGNAEAARRAGISVARIRLTCFMLCSTIAAVAGLLLASRTNSVSPTTGGSDFLLYGVGAAVIGGTSLFGGKGRVVDALLGGLVVAVINNGMLLLDQPAAVVYMVTGGVLLLAASVDAISRRRATATGRV